MAFAIIVAGILMISPVSADYGYTQKWMGSPTWLQEKGVVSTFEPKLFRGAELQINLSLFTTNYLNAGKDYLIAGSFNNAKTSFDSALGRDPESFDAWFGRAYALEALKRYQIAVESYDTAIKFSKNNKYTYLAYAGKGRSSLENQKYQDAVTAFEKAIETYQSSAANNLTELGNLHEGLNDAEEKLGPQTEANDTKKNGE
ncbi:MAG: tetratricopeptide repeat protein [Methanobacteriota archaeon]